MPSAMTSSLEDPALISLQRHPQPTPASARRALMDQPRFGTVFTDHMVTVQWTKARGWYGGELGPRGPIALHPAAAVFHYAQEIFEGLKAYRTPDGEVVLFRPEANARRFAASAARMAMPEVPEALFLAAVEALVGADEAWIPEDDGSLYLRPFLFATEAFLGVRPAEAYAFCVIACPVGSYFKGGAKPVKVWASDAYSRAAPGGTGAAKCGGNYAAGLLAQAEAADHGCDQVIFLDAVHQQFVEELGGMNVFFVMEDGELRTPPLGGTILPGVTRDCVITLGREAGLRVEERPYSFAQLEADAESGRLREAFACGTAAVVAAIGEVRHASGAFQIGGGLEGAVTTTLRSRLTAIQRGQIGDPYGWRHPVVTRP